MGMRSIGLLFCVVAGLFWARPSAAFHYFEHKWIGDLACAAVNQQRSTALPCVLQAPGGAFQISFGDLVALAGDHYDTPEDLREAVAAAKLPDKLRRILEARDFQAVGVRGWLRSGRRLELDGVKECVAVATLNGGSPLSTSSATKCLLTLLGRASHVSSRGAWLHAEAGDCYVDTQGDETEFIDTPDYLTLAANDHGHFQPAVYEFYSKHWAAAAEEFASAAHHVAAQDASQLSLAWAEAAFALHYFTDAFATGHMRTDVENLLSRDAKRGHDYDSVRGLDVTSYFYFALSDGSKPGPWQATNLWWHGFGDKCLLGVGSADHHAITVLGAGASLAQMLGENGLRVTAPGREMVLRAPPLPGLPLPCASERAPAAERTKCVMQSVARANQTVPGSALTWAFRLLLSDPYRANANNEDTRDPRNADVPEMPELLQVAAGPFLGVAVLPSGKNWVASAGVAFHFRPRPFAVLTLNPFLQSLLNPYFILEGSSGGKGYSEATLSLGLPGFFPVHKLSSLVVIDLGVGASVVRAPGQDGFVPTMVIRPEMSVLPPGPWRFGLAGTFSMLNEEKTAFRFGGFFNIEL